MTSNYTPRRAMLWSASHSSPHAPFPSSITSALFSTANSTVNLTGNFTVSNDGTISEVVQPGSQQAALLELEEFIHTLFTYKFEENFFWQMGAAGVFLFVVIIVGAGIVGHRIYTRRFWLVKLMRKSDGSYIVPNALNTFLIFEGIFCIVWIAQTVLVYLAYGRRVGHLQHHLLALSAATWIPLIYGATFCGWGTFYTAPGALDGNLRKTLRGFAGGFKVKTAVINVISLGSPILLFASVLTPALISQKELSRSWDKYLDWRVEVLQAARSPNGTVSVETAQSLLSQASSIWDQQASAVGQLGITYLIWSGWAGIFIVFYFVAAGSLILVLYKQLRKQKVLVKGLVEEQEKLHRAQLRDHAALSIGGTAPTNTLVNTPALPSHRRGSDGPNGLQPQGGSLLFSPLGGQGGSAPLPTVEDGSHGRNQVPKGHERRKSEPREVFFPRIREDAKKLATRRISSYDSPMTRFRYLQRCFASLTLLYLGVVLGATLYFIIASRCAAEFYSAALAGPDATTRLIYTSHLPAAWGAVVFGLLTFGAIFCRDLDPASSARPSDPSAYQTPAFQLPLAAPKKFSFQDEKYDYRKRPSQSASAFGSSAQLASTVVDGQSQHRRGSTSWTDWASKSTLGQPRRVSPPFEESISPTSPVFPMHSLPPVQEQQQQQQQSSVSSTPQTATLKLKHKLSNIRAARKRSATVSEMEDVGQNVFGVTSAPEGSTSFGTRSNLAYYPTPYGPMPAPARFEIRPLAPEAYPPPLSTCQSQEGAPSLGDGHGDVNLEEVFGKLPGLQIDTNAGKRSILSPAVKRMYRRSDLSIGTLSAASPSVESLADEQKQGTSMSKTPSDPEKQLPRVPQAKTSDWVLRELIRLDQERAQMGMAPIAKPLVRKRPSYISLAMETPTTSMSRTTSERSAGQRHHSDKKSSANSLGSLFSETGVRSPVAYRHEFALASPSYIPSSRWSDDDEQQGTEVPNTPLAPKPPMSLRRKPQILISNEEAGREEAIDELIDGASDIVKHRRSPSPTPSSSLGVDPLQSSRLPTAGSSHGKGNGAGPSSLGLSL